MSVEQNGNLAVGTRFPLSEFIDTVHENYHAIRQNEPMLAETAEAVHSAFQELLHGPSQAMYESDGIAHALIWKTHETWIEAHSISAGGQSDLGRSALRRSIEFCCNMAKIIGNNRRTSDYINFHTDSKAEARFRKAAKIPDAFESERYRQFWPLIYYYDPASDMGTHANLGTLAGKWQGVEGDTARYNYQVSAGDAFWQSAFTAHVGYQMLTIIRDLWRPRLKDPSVADQLYAYATEKRRHLVLDIARRQHPGGIPGHLISTIIDKDRTAHQNWCLEQIQKRKERLKKPPSDDQPSTEPEETGEPE